MFDIGFFELLILLIVALVVIGPERLPSTVRSVSLWIGRMKRSLNDTRNEIEKQIGADEIRRKLHNEEIMQSLGATKEEIDRALNAPIGEGFDYDKKQAGQALADDKARPEDTPEPEGLLSQEELNAKAHQEYLQQIGQTQEEYDANRIRTSEADGDALSESDNQSAAQSQDAAKGAS